MMSVSVCCTNALHRRSTNLQSVATPQCKLVETRSTSAYMRQNIEHHRVLGAHDVCNSRCYSDLCRGLHCSKQRIPEVCTLMPTGMGSKERFSKGNSREHVSCRKRKHAKYSQNAKRCLSCRWLILPIGRIVARFCSLAAHRPLLLSLSHLPLSYMRLLVLSVSLTVLCALCLAPVPFIVPWLQLFWHLVQSTFKTRTRSDSGK